MKPKEYLWSDEILALVETAEIKMSNRVCCAFLNRMMHRNEDDALKMRTISDICTRHGNEILAYQDQHASDILAAHQFNIGTCKFGEKAEIEELSQEPSAENQSDSASVDLQSQINDYIASYNAKKTDGVTIQMTTRQKSEIEISKKSTVYIALDGVCVKKQKEKRESAEGKANTSSENTEAVENISAPPKQKSRPSVETSVAHISFNGQRYILLAKDMLQLCLHVLAFLIEHKMLKDMQLVFLTDGAKDIRSALEKVFYFRKYTVVLDWFHLVKHCSETVSMMLRTGKENRSKQYEMKRLLFRYLWCGNVQGAITYIRELKSDDIRNEKRRTELIEYLERKEYAIPCYAVRRFLGLIVTSNPVEKANDLTVAHRQKKKSMSWSCRGSNGLAALTALYMNHEDTVWHSNRALSYKMYEKYHDGLVA